MRLTAKSAGMQIPEPDMTPMIDMTFQLIAFFMVLMNFSQSEQDERVMLPHSVLAKPPDHPVHHTVTIQMTRDGIIIYGGQELASLSRLRPYLVNERMVLEGRGKPMSDASIVIRADRLAKVGDVQQLIRVCQEERFSSFVLRAKEEFLP